MTSHPQILKDALSDPAVWPDRPERVESVETHISWVFLTRDFAWKIKKPVTFGFLDFRTLDQRKHFCEEEVRLNQRTAPELYLGVIPISGSADAPEIEGTGEPIEFAVKMRRFDAAGLLSRIAIEKRLTSGLIDDLATEIADFHATIARAGPESPFGCPSDIQRDALENFTAIEELANGDDRHKAAVQHLRTWTIAEGQRLAATLTHRRTDGFVRECHGDLHLRNIVEIDGRPRLFDCVDFNAGFRWVDVISEVAFLIMDLEEHGEERFSRRLLNRYLERTGDYDGLNVLRYYLVYRAMIRAKIDMIRLQERSLSTGQRRVLLTEFGNYLSIASHGADHGHRHDHDVGEDFEQALLTLIITHGLSGSGKTTMSQRIIEHSPVIRIRSDIERKRLHGIGEIDRASGAAAARLYSPESTRQTYAHLASLARTVIDAGFSVIVDATFLRAGERAQFRDLARQLNVAFRIVACTASEEELLTRVSSRVADDRDASDAGVEFLQQQLQDDTGISSEPADEVVTVDTASDASVREALIRLAPGGLERPKKQVD